MKLLAFTVRREKEYVCVPGDGPFYHLQSSAQGLVLLTTKICLPTLINVTRIVPHRHEMDILGYFRLCQHDN